MAKVDTTREYSEESADYYLAYLEDEWNTVPEYAEWWPELDAVEKEVIQMEWAIPQGRLAEVRDWSEKGLLSPEQQARYEALLKLIEQHRPTLERLFREEEPTEERKAA